MIHNLKTLSEYYQQVLKGNKKFELRKNDRDYKLNDILNLIEILDDGTPTGNNLNCKVTYILNGGKYGLDDNYVIMSIDKI